MTHKEESGAEKTASDASVTGLNDNLEFMGKQLHVQTEKIGFPTPHIVTQVFCSGRILTSKKSEIPPFLLQSVEAARLQDLMRDQHTRTMREISDKQKRLLDSREAAEPK